MDPRPRVDIGPQPGGQQEFLACDSFECFFGGKAGPGKTWVLVWDALGLQFKNSPLQRYAIEVPEYRAVIFRRKTTEFGQLLDEAKKYYPLFGGRFVGHRHGDPGPCFVFPDLGSPGKEGAKIFVCHMNHEANKEDHQGKEYQYAGFDELTQFTVTQYTYIFSRTRTNANIAALFARVRSTGNPTGEHVAWVKKRFPKSLKEHETAWFLQEGELKVNPAGHRVPEGTPDALSRTFIPGIFEENKYRDLTYPAKLKAMGPLMQRALGGGDWDALAGDLFPEFSYTMVIPPFEIPKSWNLFASIDPGQKSPCSFSMRAVDPSGNVYRLMTYYESERSAPMHAVAIKKAIAEFPHTHGRMPQAIVAGPGAFSKQDRFGIIAHNVTFADQFEAEGLFLTPAADDRIMGWWAMRNLMAAKRYFVFDTFNTPFLEELADAVSDENQPEDLSGRGNDPNISDHALDDDRYGVMAVYQPAAPKEQTGTPKTTMNWPKKKQWRPGMG